MPLLSWTHYPVHLSSHLQVRRLSGSLRPSGGLIRCEYYEHFFVPSNNSRILVSGCQKAKFLSFLSVRGTLLMQRRQLLLSGRKSSGVNEIESKSAIFMDGNVITFNRSESALFRVGENGQLTCRWIFGCNWRYR